MMTSSTGGHKAQLFLNNGHPYTILPMDNSGYRASVTWNSIGTYNGKPVGCTLTLSNPAVGNGYNNNAGFNQKLAQFYQQHFGTKSFFLVSDAFAAWDSCHWLLGLKSIKMVYQFFYSDRPGEYIDLDWAYLGARSIQCDGGGYEWISPAENNQDAYFIPRGVDTQLFFTNFDGYSCISSRVNEVSDRTCAIIAYKGPSISCVRGDTVYGDGFQFDFQSIDNFCSLSLKKSSTNPDVTKIDPEYFSLAGAEYAIYCDEACTRKCGTFKTDENGEATLSAVNGTNKLICEHGLLGEGDGRTARLPGLTRMSIRFASTATRPSRYRMSRSIRPSTLCWWTQSAIRRRCIRSISSSTAPSR